MQADGHQGDRGRQRVVSVFGKCCIAFPSVAWSRWSRRPAKSSFRSPQTMFLRFSRLTLSMTGSRFITMLNAFCLALSRKISLQRPRFPLLRTFFRGTVGQFLRTDRPERGRPTRSLAFSKMRIMPRAFQNVFSTIGGDTKRQYLVRASYLEIYNEEI